MAPTPSSRPLARGPILAAVLVTLVVLTLSSNGYGYHRDELYFRMLPPAWGYLDQPPLVPALAQWSAAFVDQPWALRVPATLAACCTVLLAGLLARECVEPKAPERVSQQAQTWAAWGTAVATMPLCLGHVLLTATIDLPIWLGIILAGIRAMRGGSNAWLMVGVLGGLATYNRLLVAILALSLAAGVLLFGPRKALRRWQLWVGAGLAVLLATPNLLYQATHDWPQFAMGEALSAKNLDDVRSGMPLMLTVMISPVWIPVWLAGLMHAWRCRETRWLLTAFAAVVGFTYASGAQPHYPVAMLVTAFALGCVPVAGWVQRRRWGRTAFWAGFAVQAVVALSFALPVLPQRVLAQTPIPELNQLSADQVGWPRYVEQVARVYRSAPEGTVIITSNYGEAGAIARYGPSLGLPHPYSGHNALGYLAGPPTHTRTALIVGDGVDRTLFRHCEVRGYLDNGTGVPNEEQRQPVHLCTEPSEPWSLLWPRLRHLS